MRRRRRRAGAEGLGEPGDAELPGESYMRVGSHRTSAGAYMSRTVNRIMMIA